MPCSRRVYLMNNESQLTMNSVEVNQVDFSQESASEISPTIGSLLEAARKEQNWTVQQISDQLKLSHAQIVALEANQYHLLPTLVIVRGFVRAYAKLLKIDPNPLIALLPKDNAPKPLDDSLKPALSTPFVDSKLSLLGRGETNRLYIIGAFVLVLLVGLFLISQTSFIKNLFNTQFSSSQQKVLVKNDAHNINLEVAKQSQSLEVASQEVIQTLPEKKVEQLAASIDQLGNLQSGIAADNITGGNEVATKPISAVVNVIDNNFVLRFRENSWIQIKTEKGVVIAERLVKAGSEEKFEVNQTLLVRIGNVAGVDASLRGEVFKFSPLGGSNVVNFSIK